MKNPPAPPPTRVRKGCKANFSTFELRFCSFQSILLSSHHKPHHVHPQRYENLTPTPDGARDPVYVNRAALLPAYRPSPDYDVVMQQRMMMQQQQQHQHHPNQSHQNLHQHQQQQHLQPHFEEITPTHLGAAQVYVHPDGMAYSQPEIRHNTHSFRSNSFSIGNTHSHDDEHGNYANVEALKNYGIYANIFQDLPHHGHYQVGRSGSISGAGGVGGVLGPGGSLAVHPTYSSPDLHTGGEALIHSEGNAFTSSTSSVPGNPLSAQEAILAYHQYRPPPPYSRTSSSTPDLAVVTSTAPNPSLTAQAGLERQHDLPQPQEKSEINHHNKGLLEQAQLGHSLDDLSVLQALQSAAPHQISEDVIPSFSSSLQGEQEVSRVGEESQQQNIVSEFSKDEVAAEGGRRASDASTHKSSARSSVRGTGDLPLVKESVSKVLSDDPDDTSSEHSYSTFHAKESEESSDEEEARPKVALASQQKEEPKIQIRMFAPDEAPPMSKIKEEATLRESFRRMKIVRTSSLSNEGHVSKRSSLRGLKELGGPSSYVNPAPLNVVNEQPQDLLSTPNSEPLTGGETSQNDGLIQAPEMVEVLDRLGDPPPYPLSLQSDSVAVSNSDILPEVNGFSDLAHNNNLEAKKITEVLATDLADIDSAVRDVKPDNHELPVKIPVKRSSATGIPSLSNFNPPAPPPPRREPIVQKQHAATFNLDTVVPLSKPGMVRFVKEGSVPDMGTSVLRSEVTSTNSAGMTDSDSGSSKGQSEHDKEESGSDNLASLNDYSMGSDSDSEHDKVSVSLWSFV